MSAIAVCVGDDARPALSVDAMLAAVPHRGLEVDTITVGRAAFGVRYERSGAASVAADDGHVAGIVGCLDNAADLRRELRAAGHHVPDGSAAGVLLAAVRAWGDDGLARLRGSYTGAWFDGTTLRFFRDHFGSRPLYWHHRRGAVFVATEIKQVVAGAGLTGAPDVEQLERIFYGDVEDGTAVAGVSRARRTSVGETDGSNDPVFRRYWDPRDLLETSRLSAAEAREGVAALLERAVARCVGGEDAVLLSGGVDSTAVAAFASPVYRRVADRALPALSAVYPDHPSVDERTYIEMAADAFGINLSTYVPRAGALDDVERWVDLLDGPVDSLAIPQVAEAYRRAHGLGARSILTGEVAEYVFQLGNYLLDHFLAHGRLSVAARVLRDRHRRGRSWPALARQVARAIVPPAFAST